MRTDLSAKAKQQIIKEVREELEEAKKEGGGEVTKWFWTRQESKRQILSSNLEELAATE